MKFIYKEYEIWQEIYELKGYPFYEGANNINLLGERSGYDIVNKFDDILMIIGMDSLGNPYILKHPGTTDPGSSFLNERMGNKDGTAILIPGYYKGCWQIGRHAIGKPHEHHALRQYGSPFKVWRDFDKDGVLDPGGKIYTNVTGLNMHTTFKTNVDNVDSSSAGCQVRKFHRDHDISMSHIVRSSEKYGDIFSYALWMKNEVEENFIKLAV